MSGSGVRTGTAHTPAELLPILKGLIPGFYGSSAAVVGVTVQNSAGPLIAARSSQCPGLPSLVCGLSSPQLGDAADQDGSTIIEGGSVRSLAGLAACDAHGAESIAS